MSSAPGFVTTGMNLPLKRVNVISLFAADMAGTRSFYQEVLGLPLTFESEPRTI
jgi:catechol-2,3-dioxygenase